MEVSPSSHADSWTPELEQLLSTWHRRMDACQHAYYLEAERYKRWHLWLGIPAIIFSTVVGTAVFATLESQTLDISARVIVALVSIAAAVLADLQTFLRLSEAAAAHGQSGDWYSAIKRDIEQLRALRRRLAGDDALVSVARRGRSAAPTALHPAAMMTARGAGRDGL